MAVSTIFKLSKSERATFFSNLNYLNLAEIKSFCNRHNIPYKIVIESSDESAKFTGEIDRKGIILDRIRHFVQTGSIMKETRFPIAVVCFDPLPLRLTESDKLFYGQYKKANAAMTALLKRLTNGEFRDGAIARILARDFWTRGKAPTFREFATAWRQAVIEYTSPNPEWAFLSDRKNKAATDDWKALRKRKASEVLRVLSQLD